MSSSNVSTSSTGPTEEIASYTQSNASNPSERINPFDKNKPPERPAPPVVPAAKSADTSLDDLTKNRFEKYQGKQDQSTGRYALPPTGDSSSPKLTDATSAYARTLSSDVGKAEVAATTASEVKRTDASKYSFGSGSFARSSSTVSDVDVVFGGTENRASFERSFSTASNSSPKKNFGRDSFAASVDVSDSIYASKREPSYNRSLSVSSEKDGDFTTDPRVNTSYRIYEGIQNAGFTDFDSPVKTSAAAKAEDAEDDYDLK